jgi:hypothetical protein
MLKGRAALGRGEPPGASRSSLEPGAAVVFTRLADAGIPTHAPAAVNRVYANASVWKLEDPDASEKSRKVISAAIGQRLAPIPPALVAGGHGCEHQNFGVKNRNVAQVWRWPEGGDTHWLLQKICFDRGDADGHFVLLASPTGAAINLDAQFPEEALAGKVASESAMYARVFLAGERLLAIAIPLSNHLAFFDSATGTRTNNAVPLVEGALLNEVRLTTDGQFVVQLNRDGRFFVHRYADGKRVLVGAHVDDEVLVATADGLYDTSYEGAQLVQIRFPGDSGLYRFYQFEAALRRRGLARAILSGQDVAAPPTVMPAPPTADLVLGAAMDGARAGTS